MNSWRADYRQWLMVLVVFALGGAAVGQPYPVKAVRIIVPFPAGTGADIVARHFTPKLAQILGQQFIVDNRAGAAGNIGAEAAARAAPDGYTLLMASASVAVGQSVYKNLRFNLARDFESISLVGTAPFVLAVHPSLPARSAVLLPPRCRRSLNRACRDSSRRPGGRYSHRPERRAKSSTESTPHRRKSARCTRSAIRLRSRELNRLEALPGTPKRIFAMKSQSGPRSWRQRGCAQSDASRYR